MFSRFDTLLRPARPTTAPEIVSVSMTPLVKVVCPPLIVYVMPLYVTEPGAHPEMLCSTPEENVAVFDPPVVSVNPNSVLALAGVADTASSTAPPSKKTKYRLVFPKITSGPPPCGFFEPLTTPSGIPGYPGTTAILTGGAEKKTTIRTGTASARLNAS